MLGVFVPSGGSKWVVEAPYVMAAAHELKVHLGWVVASYDLGEALANLVQPFWMLPILGLFQLRARDVMGYTFIVFLVLVPVGAAARDDARRDPGLSALARTRPRTGEPNGGRWGRVPGILLFRCSPPEQSKTRSQRIPSELFLMAFACSEVVSKDDRPGDERLSTNDQHCVLVYECA